MDNVFDMKDFIGTSQGDKAHMLGKFLYFSLSSLLIDREALKKLAMGQKLSNDQSYGMMTY